MIYDDMAVEIINRLFAELVAINPAFKQAWPTEREFQATKQQWMMAFQDAGINSFEQIRKGLKAIRLSPSPFVPAPGEFIRLCRPSPEEINAPSAREAYLEACLKSHPGYGDEKRWSHPAVELARNKVRPYRLCNLPEKETYKEFEKAYLEACEQIISGRNLNQIEEAKREYTQIQMNWVLRYKKCIDEGINPEESGYFPSEEMCHEAEKLYHAWSKRQ